MLYNFMENFLNSVVAFVKRWSVSIEFSNTPGIPLHPPRPSSLSGN